MSRPLPVPDASSILYQDASGSVLLLDIPTSIALAQNNSSKYQLGRLASCLPLRYPHPSTEPKSDTARSRLIKQTDEQSIQFNTVIHDEMQKALAGIRSVYKNSWIVDRYIPDAQDDGPTFPPGWKYHPNSEYSSDPSPPLILSASHQNIVSSFKEISNCLVSNLSDNLATLRIGTDVLLIPPHSSFILANIQPSRLELAHAAKKFLPPRRSCGAGEFDLIILDPPWSNRSVRRTKGYLTTESQRDDPWPCVAGMLKAHIAPNGYVAVWVTNKRSIRDQVLEVFRGWSVVISEIWVWMKVTTQGEAIFPIDGLWRNPYEILLIGQRKLDSSEPVSNLLDVPRRVITAVPDIHSRKPCLKELVNSYLFSNNDYRCLEVFARNLTADWWSWGNEVLKFNMDKQWEQVRS